MNTTQTPSFEGSLLRLEEIVRKLERGELPLEEALDFFKEGVDLVKICNQRLQAVEGQVEILIQQLEGEYLDEGGLKTDGMD
jgi:exodeoxyribonuclease VII small subunit